MGFLKRIMGKKTAEGDFVTPQCNTFEQLTDEQLEAHLGIARYGNFYLTDAVRPSFNLDVVPQQGYRHDCYHDEQSKTRVPVLMASASREVLFELFMELLEPLGDEVDVVLETSHNRQGGGHEDLYREHIDMPVLKSMLYDYEEMLMNDGCAGIAVINPNKPQEVQFDEHKLLIVYGKPLEGFERILRSRGVHRCPEMQFITEAEHVHSSSDGFHRQFDELITRLGMDGALEY